MASSLKHMSFKAIPANELENADDVQLKTMAHSLLESKLEKIMSTAGNAEELSKTKKLAVEWMRKWDLDGDGILSSVEMKGAAMEHARLQRDYKTRGTWMIVLALLIFCCGGVILGVSIWANAISKDSEVESGDDLGGYTMRKKDGTAVVKTATALYQFRLPRIGFLPFDELSTIESISFLYKQSMRQMSVEGFKWFGTHNITFFSPRNEELTITKSTDTDVTMTLREPGAATPAVVYTGMEPNLLFQSLILADLDNKSASGTPVTYQLALNVSAEIGHYFLVGSTYMPPQCMAFPPGVAMDPRNMTTWLLLPEPCATILAAALEGLGIVEARIGPQDYFGTEMTAEEKAELVGPNSLLTSEVFSPGLAGFLKRSDIWLRKTVKTRYNAVA